MRVRSRSHYATGAAPLWFFLEYKLFTEFFADGGGGGEDPDQMRAVRTAQQVLSGK